MLVGARHVARAGRRAARAAGGAGRGRRAAAARGGAAGAAAVPRRHPRPAQLAERIISRLHITY